MNKDQEHVVDRILQRSVEQSRLRDVVSQSLHEYMLHPLWKRSIKCAQEKLKQVS